MLTAQALYDRREERGEIDGTDLHSLFADICGDPSPAGRTLIDVDTLAQYAAECRAAQHGTRPAAVIAFIDGLLA